jgi:hypothetical protein
MSQQLDLASLAAAGAAENMTRQQGAQQLQSAAQAQALSEQLGALAAESEAARRNYSFQNEQGALDRQLQLGLQRAQAARSGGGGGGGSSRAAEMAFQMAMQQKENEEWYRRQQFQFDLEQKATKGQQTGPRFSDFGSNQVMGSRGKAIIDNNRAYRNKEISVQDFLRGGGGFAPAINTLQSERGAQHIDKTRSLSQQYGANPQQVADQTYKYFRDLAKKKDRPAGLTASNADEWASISLAQIGFLPELAG